MHVVVCSSPDFSSGDEEDEVEMRGRESAVVNEEKEMIYMYK